MKRLLIAIAICLAFVVWVATSGCTSAPFKAAVAAYTSTLQERGAAYYGLVEPELRRELVLNDAALVCLVDEDGGASSSPACACSKGDPDAWEENCLAWIGGAE